MRQQVIAEIGGSLVIAMLTGLCAFAGLSMAAYGLFAMHPALKTLGLIGLLFGIENMPLFVMWSRQTLHEITNRADALIPTGRRAPLPD